MRLSELIEQLTECAEEIGDETDPEVRLAFQPSWPLQYDVDVARWVSPETDGTDETVVYIGEGGQVYDDPYLPGAAAEALGWAS